MWWFLGYCAVSASLWLSFVRTVLHSLEKDGLLDNEMRGLALFVGTAMVIVWPLSLVCRTVYRWASKTDLLVTDGERAKKAERELWAAKQMAKAAGLPWPKEEKK